MLRDLDVVQTLRMCIGAVGTSPVCIPLHLEAAESKVLHGHGDNHPTMVATVLQTCCEIEVNSKINQSGWKGHETARGGSVGAFSFVYEFVHRWCGLQPLRGC